MAKYRYFIWLGVIAGLITLSCGAVFADVPRAPAYVCVDDHPDDDGTAMDLIWPRSPDDGRNQDNVTEYRIFRVKRGTGTTVFVESIAADGSDAYSYTDTGLEPMTLYFFAVRATGPDGASEAVGRWRKTVNNTLDPPAAPENFDATDLPDDQGGACVVEWDNSPDDGEGEDDVIMYHIFRRRYFGGAFVHVVSIDADGSEHYSYTDHGCSKGYVLQYAVRAYDNNKQSVPVYDQIRAFDNTAPGPPQNFQAEWNRQGNGRSIRLDWDASPDDGQGQNDVKEYWFWRRQIPGGQLELVHKLNADDSPSYAFLDVGLAVDTVYEYYIRAWDGENTSTAEYDKTATKDKLAPGPPSNFEVADRPDDNGDALVLSWDKSPDDGEGLNDVVHYKIWRRLGTAGEFQNVANVPADGSDSYDYTDSGLQAKKTYYYIIAAYDGFNISQQLLASGTTVDDNPCRPPQNLVLKDIGGGMLVTWDASPDDGNGLDNVVEYVVWRRTVPGSYTTLPRIEATDATSYDFADGSLNVGETYEYAVAAFNGHTVSDPVIARKTVTAPVAPPRDVQAQDHPYDHGSVIDVSFTRSPDDGGGRDHVAKYEIFRKVANVNYEPEKVQEVQATGASSYTVADTVPDNFILYEYTVRAVSNTGVTSEFAGPARETAQDNLVESFQPPQNLTAQDQPNDDGGAIRLRWYRSSSEGDPGVPPPPPLSAGVDSQTTYAGVYEFYRRQAGRSYGDAPAFEVSADGTSDPMTYIDTGLANGVTYYYKVRYRRYNQISPFTNEASATPAVGTASVSSTNTADTADNEKTVSGETLSVHITAAPDNVEAGQNSTVEVSVKASGRVTVSLEWAAEGGSTKTGDSVVGSGTFTAELTLPVKYLPPGTEVTCRAFADTGRDTAKSETRTITIQ